MQEKDTRFQRWEIGQVPGKWFSVSELERGDLRRASAGLYYQLGIFPFPNPEGGVQSKKKNQEPLVFEVLLEMFRPERSKNQGRRIKRRSELKRRDHSFK